MIGHCKNRKVNFLKVPKTFHAYEIWILYLFWILTSETAQCIISGCRELQGKVELL